MKQLTENDVLSVPEFTDSNPPVSQLNELSKAVHALQRVVVFQHQEITRLQGEVTTAKRTATSAKNAAAK